MNVLDQRFLPKFSLFLLLIGFFLLSGCSTYTYNALLTEDNLDVTRDVDYGSRDRQRLDIYRPTNVKKPRPVVVFIHGGAWNSGDKQQYFFVARALVNQDYVVVIPNYRLLPEATFPDFVWDTARAVRWTMRNVDDYAGDSDSIYLMGHSAGAYNAAMVSYDDRYLRNVGNSNDSIKGFIGLAGLYDFQTSEDEHLRKVFREPPEKEFRPVDVVDPEDPPALLFHGTRDQILDPKNSRQMAKTMQNRGPWVRYIEKEGLDHVDMLLTIGPYFHPDYDVLSRINQFIRNH